MKILALNCKSFTYLKIGVVTKIFLPCYNNLFCEIGVSRNESKEPLQLSDFCMTQGNYIVSLV